MSDDAKIAMFNSYTLYCDAAGGKDHGFIVVAGYLSTFAKWNAFVAEWKFLLASFNVPYFHMKEFTQSKGPFASWTDKLKRDRFMERAADIIARHVERGYASLVEFDTFDEVDREYHLSMAVGNPYALAGRTCVARASIFIGSGEQGTFVFDHGDEGRGELIRILERDGFSSPLFRPSRDRMTPKGLIRGMVQLQAADFAAYELRKVFKDDPLEEWPLDEYRKSLVALARIRSDESDWGRYSKDDLIEFCRKARIPKRNR